MALQIATVHTTGGVCKKYEETNLGAVLLHIIEAGVRGNQDMDGVWVQLMMTYLACAVLFARVIAALNIFM